MNRKTKLDALVGAAGVVFGLGGYVGNLYSSNIATFGMIAIFILGGVAVRFVGDD
jgi:hypothetical protein